MAPTWALAGGSYPGSAECRGRLRLKPRPSNMSSKPKLNLDLSLSPI